MKSFRILLMSVAIVIAVGGAFAAQSSMFVDVWVSANSNGSPGQQADVTIPTNCSTSNDGVQCRVESGPHQNKYIFETGTIDPLKKP